MFSRQSNHDYFVNVFDFGLSLSFNHFIFATVYFNYYFTVTQFVKYHSACGVGKATEEVGRGWVYAGVVG